jgi:uncharacterized protein YaaR (DUF327 family)
MKVSDIGKISSNVHNAPVAGSTQPGPGQGVEFSRHMMNFSEAQYRKYIEDLKDRINRQGDAVKQRADIGAFLQYRKLIAELLEVAAGNAYACTRTSAFDAKGRRNVFVLIKQVNAKLDEMAQQILTEQQDTIRLLEMVDDVRGLLLDILL